MRKSLLAVVTLLLAFQVHAEPKCYTDDKGQFLYLEVKESTALFNAQLNEGESSCALFGELAKNNSEYRGIISDSTAPYSLPCAVSVREALRSHGRPLNLEHS